MHQSEPFRLANARVVFPSQVVTADVIVRDGFFDRWSPESFPGCTIDLEQDYLMPGFVELHTDNLERHIEPRPGTFAPLPLAVQAHDAELAAAGITTAFDALSLGGETRDQARSFPVEHILAALDRACTGGTLRADHFLHLRCELSDAALSRRLEAIAPPLPPALVSLMDHTPGQGQYCDLDRFRRYYMRRYALDRDEVEAIIRRRQADHAAYAGINRCAAAKFANRHGAKLLSHDDRTADDIRLAMQSGCQLVEFPTSRLAAREAKQAGLSVIAGAPNLLRGESLSGNVAAADLIRENTLDILSSDYYPPSLVGAVFKLEREFGIDLAKAVAMASLVPAGHSGMDDRGAIAVGLRADFIRVRPMEDGPRILCVWRSGVRIS